MRTDFESLSPSVLASLFKVLIVTIKVIADSAHECILSFLPYANTGIPIICEGCTNVHPTLRSKCAEYICAILAKVRKYMEMVINGADRMAPLTARST